MEAHMTGDQSHLAKIKLVNNHDEVKVCINKIYHFQQYVSCTWVA